MNTLEETSSSLEEIVEICLLGKNYKVSIAYDRKACLMDAVTFLNERAAQIPELGSSIPAEKIALMLALNISYDFLYFHKNAYSRISHLNHFLKDLSS